jgi:PTH1 family peptidyl-tRNA hydrolase
VSIFHLLFKPSEAETQTFVLVGLGNPGREYRQTRHNVGFMVIDELCQQFNLHLSRMQAKALVGNGILEGRKVILAKPQTFMNLSGKSVASLVKFYKIPLSQLLIVLDDLDLPLGMLRMRPGGGSAGNKGLMSIIEHLGTEEFPRMRLGIGRPPGQKNGADYVLQNFQNGDMELVKEVLAKASKAAQTFIANGIDQAMNQFNGPLDRDY